MLWEKFMKTGKIKDYLEYKHSSEDDINANAELPGDKRRTDRRKQ